jgi:Zn-dependent protease with chaperone function
LRRGERRLGILDFAASYFSATEVLVVIVSIYAVIAGLFLVFRANVDRPRLRSNILLIIFALASSSWIFVGSSLVFCRAFEGLYYYHQTAAISMVLGASLLTTLLVGLPVSLLMATKLPALVLRRTEKALLEPSGKSSSLMEGLVRSLGLGQVRLFLSPNAVPFAYSLGGGGSVVVISRGLEENLDRDEMETVLVHELAHLRSKDTQLNALITVYRRALFFDPLIRVLEGVIHREREFACDEVSARETRKPLSLASALLKIHSLASGVKPPGAFLAGNIALYGNHTLKERIDRLMRIADEFAKT